MIHLVWVGHKPLVPVILNIHVYMVDFRVLNNL